MNKAFLIGRLTRDPELRYTASNVPVVTFSLAVNRPFPNQAGEREADFINIVVWNKPAENCHKFIKKGSKVAIDGRIQTRSYQDSAGNKKYLTEVIAERVEFLDPKSDNGTNPSTNSTQEPNNTHGSVDPFQEMHDQMEEQQKFEYSDEEMPF